MRTRATGIAAALIILLAAPTADAREPLGNKWRITSVDITGVYAADFREDTTAMKIYAETSYKGRRPGKPFELRLSNRRPKVFTAPVTYSGGSEATYTAGDVSYNCDYDPKDAKHKLVGVMWLTPNGLRVQWNLVPMPTDCPDDVDPPLRPTVPTKSMVTKVPVRKLTGKTATLPIKIDWKGSDLGWEEQFDWRGKVRIARGWKKG